MHGSLGFIYFFTSQKGVLRDLFLQAALGCWQRLVGCSWGHGHDAVRWCSELCSLLAVLFPGVPESGLWLRFGVLFGALWFAQVLQTRSSQKLLVEQAETKGCNPSTPPRHPADSPLTLWYQSVNTWKIFMLLAYLCKREEKKHVVF